MSPYRRRRPSRSLARFTCFSSNKIYLIFNVNVFSAVQSAALWIRLCVQVYVVGLFKGLYLRVENCDKESYGFGFILKDINRFGLNRIKLIKSDRECVKC